MWKNWRVSGALRACWDDSVLCNMFRFYFNVGRTWRPWGNFFNLSRKFKIVQICGMFRLERIKTRKTSLFYAPRVGFLLIYGFASKPFYFSSAFRFLLRRLTYNRTKAQAASLRECHCTTSARLQITECWDLTRVWRVYTRVCQVFKTLSNFIRRIALSSWLLKIGAWNRKMMLFLRTGSRKGEYTKRRQRGHQERIIANADSTVTEIYRKTFD